jgi:hypothetical protein
VAALFTDPGTRCGAPFLGVAATGRSVQVDEFAVARRSDHRGLGGQ